MGCALQVYESANKGGIRIGSWCRVVTALREIHAWEAVYLVKRHVYLSHDFDLYSSEYLRDLNPLVAAEVGSENIQMRDAAETAPVGLTPKP